MTKSPIKQAIEEAEAAAAERAQSEAAAADAEAQRVAAERADYLEAGRVLGLQADEIRSVVLAPFGVVIETADRCWYGYLNSEAQNRAGYALVMLTAPRYPGRVPVWQPPEVVEFLAQLGVNTSKAAV